MTDAPERIRIDWISRERHESPFISDCGGSVEYVRSDLAPREAVEGELREACLHAEMALSRLAGIGVVDLVPSNLKKIIARLLNETIAQCRAALSRASAPIRAPRVTQKWRSPSDRVDDAMRALDAFAGEEE